MSDPDNETQLARGRSWIGELRAHCRRHVVGIILSAVISAGLGYWATGSPIGPSWTVQLDRPPKGAWQSASGRELIFLLSDEKAPELEFVVLSAETGAEINRPKITLDGQHIETDVSHAIQIRVTTDNRIGVNEVDPLTGNTTLTYWAETGATELFLSPKLTYVAEKHQDDFRLRRIDRNTSKGVTIRSIPKAGEFDRQHLFWSPDEKYLIDVRFFPSAIQVDLYDSATGKILHQKTITVKPNQTWDTWTHSFQQDRTILIGGVGVSRDKNQTLVNEKILHTLEIEHDKLVDSENIVDWELSLTQHDYELLAKWYRLPDGSWLCETQRPDASNRLMYWLTRILPQGITQYLVDRGTHQRMIHFADRTGARSLGQIIVDQDARFLKNRREAQVYTYSYRDPQVACYRFYHRVPNWLLGTLIGTGVFALLNVVLAFLSRKRVVSST